MTTTLTHKPRRWGPSSKNVNIHLIYHHHCSSKMPNHKQGGKPTHQRGDTENFQRTPLVITYHPSIAPVSKIIRHNWHIISKHQSTTDIFTDPPIISYHRDNNIKDHHVRASLQSNNPTLRLEPVNVNVGAVTRIHS